MPLECPNTMAISYLSHQRPWERVAQPVEHVTFNHGVLGSSPSALTKLSRNLKLVAFAGQVAVAAVLFVVICWSALEATPFAIK